MKQKALDRTALDRTFVLVAKYETLQKIDSMHVAHTGQFAEGLGTGRVDCLHYSSENGVTGDTDANISN